VAERVRLWDTTPEYSIGFKIFAKKKYFHGSQLAPPDLATLFYHAMRAIISNHNHITA